MAKGPGAVDFFDEDDADDTPPSRGDRPARSSGGSGSSGASAPPPGGGGRGGQTPHVRPPANRQQARVRQIAFLIGAIVMLILIVIAFRGCLNARKDRSFQNYVSDLSSITADTQPLSDQFFGLLNGKASQAADDIGLQNTINGDAGTSQGLLDRAQGLDAPGELDAAQEQIVLAFELRHDALEGIAAQIDKTSGSEAKQATDAIYTQMKVLSASDILYARAKDQIEQALTDQEVVVSDGVPASQFLPDNPDYLDPAVTAAAISSAAGGTGGTGVTTSSADCQNDGKSHGLGLVDATSTLQPSGTTLTNGVAVTAPAGDDALEISVQNQGEADESNIQVSVKSDGDISGTDSIPALAAQETQSASIPFKAPAAGTAVEVTVDVATVPCEQVADNNTATYSITF
ncbi:MAG: CARDB domain-containing protein [Solirubrobacterales bacterium]